METQDRRVKRTQHLLATALIALTLEKGYEAVTIRDITERADVGYATFFRHYRDKDALLADVLEVVLSELLELLPPAPDAEPASVGTLIFRYVQEHCKMIRVLLSSQGASSLMQQLLEAGVQTMLEQQRDIGLVPKEIAAYHLVSSVITLVQWWLEHGQPYPPEQMGLIYEALLYPQRR